MKWRCDRYKYFGFQKAVVALEGTGCNGDSCPINVRISGGNCSIRSAPNTDSKILGVAHNGVMLPYGVGVSVGDWLPVQWQDQDAWVSRKDGRLD